MAQVKTRGTREGILSLVDLQEREIEVPEWDCTLLVRGLTKGKQQSLRKQCMDPKTNALDTEKFEMLLFTHCVVEPEFTTEDLEMLKNKSATAIDRVLKQIMIESGQTTEEFIQAERAFPKE